MNKLFLLIIRNWKLLGALNILLLIIVCAYKVFLYTDTWEANSKFVIPETSSKLDADLGVLGSLRDENVTVSQLVNPTDLQISILTSNIVIQRLLDIDPHKEKFEDLDDFKEIFEISTIDGTTGFKITTQAVDKNLAKQRIESYVEIFNNRLYELRNSESNSRLSFNQERLEKAREELYQAEQDLIRFQQTSGVIDPDLQTQKILDSLEKIRNRYDETVGEAIGVEVQVDILEEQIGLSARDAAAVLGLSENPTYQYVKEQLTEASSDLAKAKAAFTEDSSHIRMLQRREIELDSQLQKITRASGFNVRFDPTIATGAEGKKELIQQMLILNSQVQAKRSQAIEFEAILNNLSNNLTELPEAKAKLEDLNRDYSLAEGVYLGLLAQAQQANINAFTTYPNVQLLDPPSVSKNSDSLMLLVINWFMASVLTSAALLVLLASRNQSIEQELIYDKSLKDIKL